MQLVFGRKWCRGYSQWLCLFIGIFGLVIGLGLRGYGQSRPVAKPALVNLTGRLIASILFDSPVMDYDTVCSDTLKKALEGASLKMLGGQLKSFKQIVRMGGPAFFYQGAYYQTVLSEKDSVCIGLFFNNQDKLSGIRLLPHPFAKSSWKKPSYSIMGTQIAQFPFTSDGLTFPGLLNLPPQDRNRKIMAVMLSGSGPNDELESVGPNQVFTDIAYGLARYGVSTLRFAKRTHLFPKSLDSKTVTPEEEQIRDAVAAVEQLKKDARFADYQFYVVGHSLGAYLAPEVASRLPYLKGLVLLAPPGRPMQDLILDQVIYLSGEKPSPEAKAQIEEVRKGAKAISKKQWTALTSEGLLGLQAPYWQWLDRYHYFDKGLAFKGRMLVAFGGRDYQITAKDEKALRKAWKRRPETTFYHLANGNHLFFEGEGRSTPAEYETPGQHVSETLIETLGTWFQANP